MDATIVRKAGAAAAALAALAAASPAAAVVSIDQPNTCSDRNALRDIAVDAQLEAVKLYYKGLILNTGDLDRQVCLEAHVLLDDRFAVINQTRDLIMSRCLPVDIAARMATTGLCR